MHHDPKLQPGENVPRTGNKERKADQLNWWPEATVASLIFKSAVSQGYRSPVTRNWYPLVENRLERMALVEGVLLDVAVYVLVHFPIVSGWTYWHAFDGSLLSQLEDKKEDGLASYTGGEQMFKSRMPNTLYVVA
jgi:hypothetical protein